MLPLLAGVASLLRRQFVDRGRVGQEEVCAGTGGLLRMPAPQERGPKLETAPSCGATAVLLSDS